MDINRSMREEAAAFLDKADQDIKAENADNSYKVNTNRSSGDQRKFIKSNKEAIAVANGDVSFIWKGKRSNGNVNSWKVRNRCDIWEGVCIKGGVEINLENQRNLKKKSE